MKKIIAAFDGLKFSDSTASYAIELAKKYNGKVFGVFLEDFSYHSYSITDLIGEEAPEDRAAYLNKSDAEQRESSIRFFSKMCEDEGLIYSIHRDRNVAIRDLLYETRYADIVIIQNNETLSHYAERAPSKFITTVLERTECPVLLVPSVYHNIEKIIFLYDGEPSSVFAIKQFTYLLPPKEKIMAELLCVRSKTKNDIIPDSFYIKEWLKLHFSELEYKVLVGNPDDEIINFLKEQTKNCLVVLGAYQRGSISRMVHKSMADNIISAIDLPLFISHR